MIVWLASFPRSGNTLLRILLKEQFGLRTCSIHGDDAGIGRALTDMVGIEPQAPLDEAALAAMHAAPETFYVKTHNLPPPGRDWAAIYVLRDGRSALTSYWHYRNRPGDTGRSLPEVVAGAVQFGSWSAHVAAWLEAPLRRRLLLRYEDLAASNTATLHAIGTFVGRVPANVPPPDFTAQHALAPHHFRSGSDARNIAELQACCPALFDALHGRMQASLGYPAAMTGSTAAALAAELSSALTSLHEARDAMEARAGGAEAYAATRITELKALAARRIARLEALAMQRAADLEELRREIEAMRRSRFWQARDMAVGLSRAVSGRD